MGHLSLLVQYHQEAIMATIPKTFKLEFPRFRGENPSRWIYKANQFFQLYGTPPNQKILLASYHMEDKALIWFQDAKEAGLFTSWEAFVKFLHVRFGITAYDDPMESLTRLRQVDSVVHYKGQVESLSNRVKELSEKRKLSCFFSGLKEEIRLPVKMFNPQALSTAFGLAKIQEEYLNASRKGTKSWGEVPVSRPSILSPPPTKNDVRSLKTPFQNVPTALIEERRKKGLCFYCEEKWHNGHKCKSPKVFLMEGVQSQGLEVDLDVDLEGEFDRDNAQLES